MQSYEWMVKFTPQKEWINKGGMLVWLSFYAGILGCGSYLVSLFFDNLPGLIISWLIILIIKNGLHMAHAKNPMRMWRMALRPRTSWVARGTIFSSLLLGIGFIQIACSYMVPGTMIDMVFQFLAALSAVAVILYEGFTLNYITGIPFWNSALLPVLFIAWGILSGLAIVGAVGLQGGANMVLTAGSKTGLVITLALTILYLWNAVYAGAAARESAKKIVQGNVGFIFLGGAVLIGMVIPLIVVFTGNLASPALAIPVLACEIIGGLAFTYSVFKVGVYSPIISKDWR